MHHTCSIILKLNTPIEKPLIQCRFQYFSAYLTMCQTYDKLQLGKRFNSSLTFYIKTHFPRLCLRGVRGLWVCFFLSFFVKFIVFSIISRIVLMMTSDIDRTPRYVSNLPISTHVHLLCYIHYNMVDISMYISISNNFYFILATNREETSKR